MEVSSVNNSVNPLSSLKDSQEIKLQPLHISHVFPSQMNTCKCKLILMSHVTVHFSLNSFIFRWAADMTAGRVLSFPPDNGHCWRGNFVNFFNDQLKSYTILIGLPRLFIPGQSPHWADNTMLSSALWLKSTWLYPPVKIEDDSWQDLLHEIIHFCAIISSRLP